MIKLIPCIAIFLAYSVSFTGSFDIDRLLFMGIQSFIACLMVVNDKRVSKVYYYYAGLAVVVALMSAVWDRDLFIMDGVYRLSYLMGGLCVAYIFGKIPVKWVLITFFAVAVGQVVNNIIVMDWLVRGDNAHYRWGTVRSTIRYGTLLFAGLPFCWYLTDSEKRGVKVAGYVLGAWLVYLIGDAGSDMVLFITGLLLIIMAYFKVQNKVMFVGAVAGFAVSAYFAGLFSVDWVRGSMWTRTICYMSWFFGNGVNAFYLQSGLIGLEGVGHPHNDLLLLLYNYGIVGTLAILVPIVLVVMTAKINKYVFFPFILIVFSGLSNSIIFYPDMYILFAVFLGLMINDSKNCFNFGISDYLFRPDRPILL